MRLFRERLALVLEKRLAIHSMAYRAAYDERGRITVTLDGEEILSFCDFVQENAWREIGFDQPAPAGIFSKGDFSIAFGRYLDLSIEDALVSEDPIVIGLAMLDRRLGKRRLKLLAGQEFREPAKTLLGVRLAAEGLFPANADHSPT